ncbi:MAG: dipeptide/oligopeptide/nickel transporter ATP-binding protein [Thermomicrobiales bacterium]|nr:dipeptide/oligopeptide/nickel transporter ATP-binding protein [Thermomicrobiales bacterium]
MSTHPADQQSDAARLHRVGEPCTTARLSGQPSEATIPLVEARNLVKHFSYASGGIVARTTGTVHAVDDVSIVVPRGRTVGLVGESGCGKSTVGRLLLRLIEPTSGSVWFDGEEITRATRTEMRRVRRHMQIVFQDPHSSLNPRRKIGEIVSRPLVIHGEATRRDADRRAGELLSLVGLDSDMRGRFPHEFSGGQRQRIGVARALALRPSFIVLDEPTSSLDVSVQAQILNLLNDLKRELGLTYLFISHNLNVVEYFCDTTVVMYLGQVVESGPSEAIHAEPMHPYTRALMSAVLVPEVGRQRTRLVLSGDIPSPVNPPSGCRFHTRCPFAMEICRQVQPLLTEQAPGHRVACHLFPVDGRVPASHVAREKGGVGYATA